MCRPRHFWLGLGLSTNCMQTRSSIFSIIQDYNSYYSLSSLSDILVQTTWKDEHLAYAACLHFLTLDTACQKSKKKRRGEENWQTLR